MTDIVARLREYSRNMGGPPEDYLAWQAADEIERLQAEIRVMQKAHNELNAGLRTMFADNIQHPTGKCDD